MNENKFAPQLTLEPQQREEVPQLTLEPMAQPTEE